MSQSPPGSDKPDNTAGGPSFSPEEALQFMQRMWNPFGVAMPGFAPAPATATPTAAPAPAALPMGMGFPNPAAMFATLDPAEIERKIGELRVIEGWLQMSLNFMQMSIKTMELQKASLEALTAAHGAPKSAPEATPTGHRRRKS